MCGAGERLWAASKDSSSPSPRPGEASGTSAEGTGSSLTGRWNRSSCIGNPPLWQATWGEEMRRSFIGISLTIALIGTVAPTAEDRRAASHPAAIASSGEERRRDRRSSSSCTAWVVGGASRRSTSGSCCAARMELNSGSARESSTSARNPWTSTIASPSTRWRLSRRCIFTAVSDHGEARGRSS